MNFIDGQMMKQNSTRIQNFFSRGVSKIFSLPDLRTFFPKKQDSDFNLGKQTILFTDIVGSSQFYSRAGDQQAFAEVSDHFEEIFKEIAKHNGLVVKTIGDAVMAAFLSPEQAIAAAVNIQKLFHQGRKDTSIRLRISIHCGPVIAVRHKSGMDYFGNTVNYAAKIQTRIGAGEVAISESVHSECQTTMHAELRIEKRTSEKHEANSSDIFVFQVSSAQTAA